MARRSGKKTTSSGGKAARGKPAGRGRAKGKAATRRKRPEPVVPQSDVEQVPGLGPQLQALIQEAPSLERVRATLDRRGRAWVDGIPGAARAAFVSALGGDRPLLVVTHDADAAQALASDLEHLVGRTPLLNPALSLVHDDDPELQLSAAVSSEWGARIRILQALASEALPLAITSATGLLQRLPGPARLDTGTLELALGDEIDPSDLAQRLVARGYRRVALVEGTGEFAIRGGIVDVFPLGAPYPLRVELFGDEVESLRTFDPFSQRSVEVLSSYRLGLRALTDCRTWARADGAVLTDHLPPGAAIVFVSPGRARERLTQGAARFSDHAQDLLDPEAITAKLEAWPMVLLGRDALEDPLADGAQTIAFPFEPAALGGRNVEAVTNDLAQQVQRGERLTVTCVNDAERERLRDLFVDTGLTPDLGDGLRTLDDPPGVTLAVSTLRSGMRARDAGVWVVPSSQLFTRHIRSETTQHRTKIKRSSGGAVESFADLEEGQPVVHVSYGISLFKGIVRRDRDGQPRDYIELEFDGGTLYIPTDRIGLIRRYIGPTDRRPRLSKLGGSGWRKKTKKATEAVRDLAAELLEVQAERMVRPGHAFPTDDREQLLFNQSFGYTDTPDQARVTEEIRDDMCAERAMDRVVCGDVGYGKTELAIRAAFRCVQAGRQVAVLCPTTVLAHQHHRVFRERVAAYPIRVDVVSRFCTPAAQRESVRDAKAGKVDILIGTHRILSKDVAFKDLGLVIVDEEQRFGVEHKERIKEFCRTVDLLTLTATPIPRTLHMALSGARDISVLQTPPPGRSAVETKVTRFERSLVRRAIERELARDGQVYFIHDRVRSIERIARMVREEVPTARVVVVHGQMAEREIESRMLAFMDHQVDVLVATTLIENGIDVRRANTLIVDRADRHGLSELHQIRGRVGRSSIRAYAYLLLDEKRVLSEIAERRLRAIQEFTDLGAGFQIAMRDLEIRGAGNVLGAQQSGHIVNVGYDLYCRLLKRAMAELRGGIQNSNLDFERDLDLEAGEVQVVLDVPSYVPDAYVADPALKIDCYRKLASVTDEGDLDELSAELRDRYGPVPRVLENLFTMRRVRLRAAGHGILKITRVDKVLKLRCRSAKRLEQGVKKHKGRLRPQDANMVFVVMRDADAADEVQLAFLLELLKQVKAAPKLTPAEAAAALDPAALREERQRRMRAKQAREAVLEARKQEAAELKEKIEAKARSRERQKKSRGRGGRGGKGRMTGWKF